MSLPLPGATLVRTSAIGTLLLAFLAGAEARAEPCFLAPFLAYQTELGPWSIAVADFDKDGRVDVATANTTWNSVSVLLGRGDGSFPDRGEYGVGLVPSGLDVADFDRDGELDIVVANRDVATVSVLLGNGDGTFQRKIDTPLGVLRPEKVAAADINRDGWPDIAVIYTGGGIVSVLGGRGDGTFSGRTDYGAAYGTEGVELEDLNSDGYPDLVVAIFGTQYPGVPETRMLSVRFWKGDGFFGPSVDLRTSGHPRGVQIADMDGDRNLDLIAATAFPNEIVIFRGAGDGTFTMQPGSPTGLGTGELTVGDLDVDGRLDVVVVNWGASMVTVLRGTGNGLLGGPEQHRTGRLTKSVAIADLNGDGRQDVVTADAIANSISVLLASEDGTLPQGIEAEAGVQPEIVVSADFDSDGRPDLATANVVDTDRPVGTISVALGLGDGRFGPRTDLPGDVIPSAFQVADLDGDGHPDLAIAGATGYPDGLCAFPGRIRLHLGNGDGTFRPGGDHTVVCEPTAMAVADLNADGAQDIVVSSYGAAAVSVLLGHGDGTFGARRDFPGSRGAEIAVGDVNGDGHADLLGPGIMLGNGDGAFAPPPPFGPGPFPGRLALADLDSDGHLDLVTSREREAWVMLGNGDGSFTPLAPIPMMRWIRSISIADLDADGRPDLAMTHENENLVSVMHGNGDGTFEAKQLFGVGGGPTSIAVTDVDGDRRLDLAVANSYSNTISILLNRGPMPPPLAMRFTLRPGTLTESSLGRWVTGVLEPATGAPANAIDVASIRANGEVPADPRFGARLGDHDGNGIPDLTVRFGRAALARTLSAGEDAAVTVTGTIGGHDFLGTDHVHVRGGFARDGWQGGVDRLVLSVRPGRLTAPAPGSLAIEFSLPDAGPARLELIDVTGRVVRRQAGEWEPGIHAVELSRGDSLRPGIYFVRLVQNGRVAHARAVVIR